MAGSASVVLLDDGELDRVRLILERLGVEFALCRRSGFAESVPEARDLLITSGKRALATPGLRAREAGASGPLWLCVHGQDFAELRADLRGCGVDYLAHSAVDQESLRLLIETLLHGQDERRGAARLPVGFELTIRRGKQVHFAKLLDLSRSGARVRTDVALDLGESIELDLPPELRAEALAGLRGRVVRAESCADRAGRGGFAIGLALEPLTPEAQHALDAILSGENPATRISKLAQAQSRERRRAQRRAYRKRIAALSATDAGTPRVALGHDLSVEGIRIARQPGLRVGMRIALGLYGADAENPLTLEAEIVADHGPRGLGLVFRSVGAEQRRKLEQIVDALPVLESLGGEGGGAGRVVLSRVTAQNA